MQSTRVWGKVEKRGGKAGGTGRPGKGSAGDDAPDGKSSETYFLCQACFARKSRERAERLAPHQEKKAKSKFHQHSPQRKRMRNRARETVRVLLHRARPESRNGADFQVFSGEVHEPSVQDWELQKNRVLASVWLKRCLSP